MKERNKTLYCVVFAAVFAALIFIGTYLFRIPTGIGYIHLGDGFIFIAASLLPAPYAIAAAAIGGGLSDLIGFPLWLPATVIIKSASAVFFTSGSRKLLGKRNCFAVGLAAAVNIGGYYLYGSLISGNFVASLSEMPLNLLQELAAAVLFVSVSAVLDKNPRLKQFIFSRTN